MYTKKEATKLGKELLNKMDSKGWKLETWSNNEGWHYQVTNEMIRVRESYFYKNGPKRYYCIIDDIAVLMKNIDDVDIYDPDPNEIVKKMINICLQIIQKYYDNSTSVLYKAEDIINNRKKRRKS